MLKLTKVGGTCYWVCPSCGGGYKDTDIVFEVKAHKVNVDKDTELLKGLAYICGDCAMEVVRNLNEFRYTFYYKTY